jgi:hypothetical protein
MSKQSNQARGSQAGGGQVVGKSPGGRLHQPPSSLLGTDRKSGQTQPTGQRKSTRNG